MRVNENGDTDIRTDFLKLVLVSTLSCPIMCIHWYEAVAYQTSLILNTMWRRSEEQKPA
jgi:hypothetical protein